MHCTVGRVVLAIVDALTAEPVCWCAASTWQPCGQVRQMASAGYAGQASLPAWTEACARALRYGLHGAAASGASRARLACCMLPPLLWCARHLPTSQRRRPSRRLISWSRSWGSRRHSDRPHLHITARGVAVAFGFLHNTLQLYPAVSAGSLQAAAVWSVGWSMRQLLLRIEGVIEGVPAPCCPAAPPWPLW